MSQAADAIIYPQSTVIEQLETLETNLARALITVASAIPALASSMPRCDGACRTDTGATCSELDETISGLLPGLASVILGISEASRGYAELLGSRFGTNSPAAVEQGNDLVQAMVDYSVDMDATLLAIKHEARQLATAHRHAGTARGLLHLANLMTPAINNLDDVLEGLFS